MVIMFVRRMSEAEYINIDGMQVSSMQPFVVYPGFPRNTSGFHLSESGKSENVLMFPA